MRKVSKREWVCLPENEDTDKEDIPTEGMKKKDRYRYRDSCIERNRV